jgi:steroid 5-alpha reductase family enzyme
LKDNGIVDITWGFTFVIPNAVVLLLNKNIDHRTILSNVLVLVWAIRMALNNGLRHDAEDWRYAEMRANWMKKGQAFYYFAAYMFIYFVQSIFQIIMNSSALFISIWSTREFYFLDAVGAGVWLIGWLIELVADI